MKCIKPKDSSGERPAQGSARNAEANFHVQKRSNDDHASTSDPDARLYRKGKGNETELCFIGRDRPTAITLGADKAYDAEDFVNELRSIASDGLLASLPPPTIRCGCPS